MGNCSLIYGVGGKADALFRSFRKENSIRKKNRKCLHPTRSRLRIVSYKRKFMPAFCYSFAMAVESVTPAAESEQITFDAQCLGWIREMSGGNEQALASFYDATLGRVYGVALRIVGDESLAEEVVTTVYHEAWTSATTCRQATITLRPQAQNMVRCGRRSAAHCSYVKRLSKTCHLAAKAIFVAGAV